MAGCIFAYRNYHSKPVETTLIELDSAHLNQNPSMMLEMTQCNITNTPIVTSPTSYSTPSIMPTGWTQHLDAQVR